MRHAIFFLERREQLRLPERPGGAPSSFQAASGAGRTEWQEGGVHHHFWEGREVPGEPALTSALQALCESPGIDRSLAPALLELLTGLEATGATALFQEVLQDVLVGVPGSLRADRRRVAWLELRAPGGALLELPFASATHVLADATRLQAHAEETVARGRARAQAAPCPSGALTIVLAPGSDAGVLFHELCGHPLEGDVVLRQASYLATRRGERVAPEFVTVSDDPTAGTGGVAYSLDDEGTPARSADLLHGGRVAEPLMHRTSAAALGLEANGHGRRLDFRHLALPRMSHTVVRPHQGSLGSLCAGVADGLLVTYLTPRFIHLMSGDFCFHIPEARRIQDGVVGAHVKPGLLRGNALAALAGIQAVGADVATFHGLKGCGKLDQGGLPVSFALPSVRLGPLHVEPLS